MYRKKDKLLFISLSGALAPIASPREKGLRLRRCKQQFIFPTIHLHFGANVV
jgi:hypothetical protein